MNTALGLNFLRIVNEEGVNGWSQIYAKVPFDDVELRSKGALFGAIYGENVENWADIEVEMMTWVDEYMNGVEIGGDLFHFFEEWKRKYEKLTGVWLWMKLVGKNEREIKIVKWGKSGVLFRKNGKNIDLTRNIEEGKVIRGGVKEDETLYMWTGDLNERLIKREEERDEDKVLDIGKELVNENVAASGLVLRIEKIEIEEESEEKVEEMIIPEEKQPTEEKALVEDNKNIVEEDVSLSEQSTFNNSNTTELVGNRYVGPIGLKEKIWNWWGSVVHRDSRQILIHRDFSKRRKWAGILGVSFLLLLLVSLVTGSIKMRRDNEEKKWRNFYEPIEKNRQEAIGLVKLNPSGARKLMEDVKTTFDIKKAEFVNGRYKNEVSDLEKKINEGWVLTSGEKTTDIEDLLKIDLVRQGFVGDKMAITKEGKLLVMDSNLGVAVSAEVNSKDIRVVAGKSEGEIWLDVSGEDRKTLIMTKKGVRNVEKGQDVITFDAAVLDPVSMGRFMENIYILDRGNKEIFKYGVSGTGYGDRVRWLKQGQSVGVTPVDMAIDADIWVVGESGQVEKYRRGAKEQFSISGLPAGAKISRIAVEVEGGRIALLDVNAGMVIICNKDNGNCSQQLRADRLKQARDLEFGSEGSLYVLFPGVVGRLK